MYIWEIRYVLEEKGGDYDQNVNDEKATTESYFNL